MTNTCMDCVSYHDEDLPDIGCGECRRMPPTAIKRCDDVYTMGKYPVISEYNPVCGEFDFDYERDRKRKEVLETLKRNNAQVVHHD